MNERIGKYLIPIASKTLDVLEAFRTTQEELTLQDITQRTGISHTTAFRILFTLTHRRYVTRNDSRYRLSQVRRKPRVGFCATLELPFARAVAESLQDAASRGGLDLTVLDNGRSREITLANARTLAAGNIDVAIEFQRSHELAPLLGDLFATAGIPLIAVHVPHAGATYFGPDNYRAGLLAGQTLGQYARRRFSSFPNLLLLLDIEEAGTLLHARISGALDGLKRAIGSVALDRTVRLNGGGDRKQSRTATLSALRKRNVSERILIAAASDYSALGALDAVNELGLASMSAIVGHDGDRDALQSIADAKSPFLATVAFFPDRYGAGLVDLALRLMNGQPAPPFNYVEHQVMDKRTLAKDTSFVQRAEQFFGAGTARC
jgi:ribose transport system substrate-binding protein